MRTKHLRIGEITQLNRLDRGIRNGLAILFCLACVVILSSSEITQFLNLTGLALVLGGTLAATAIQFSRRELLTAWQHLNRVVKEGTGTSVSERIHYLGILARKVKKHGIVVLDREATDTDEQFLRIALELAADRQSQDEINRILQTEMKCSEESSREAVQVFDTLANYAPAMGLIGTLIGLVQMMSSLGDPSTIGPAMAIALLTTLYGALLANFIFAPLAGKIRYRGEEEGRLKQLTIEGILSLAREENPIVLEQRLEGFKRA